MIKLYFLIGLMLTCIFGCQIVSSQEINDDRLVLRALKEAADEIHTKYGLYFAGISERGDKENNDKYQVVGLLFDMDDHPPKSEARKITIEASKIILNKLNTEKIRPFLTVFPFTEKNIRVSVIIRDLGNDRNYSEVSYFGLLNGEIYFWYDLPNEKYQTRKENESYTDALKLLDKENKAAKPTD